MAETNTFASFSDRLTNDKEGFLAIAGRTLSDLTASGVVRVGMMLDFTGIKAKVGNEGKDKAVARLFDEMFIYVVKKLGDKGLSRQQTTLLGETREAGQDPMVLMFRSQAGDELGAFPAAMLGKSPKTVIKKGSSSIKVSETPTGDLLTELAGKKLIVRKVQDDTDLKAGETASGVPYYSKFYELELL